MHPLLIETILTLYAIIHFFGLVVLQEPPEYKLMGYTPMAFPELDSYRPPGLARKLKQGALVSNIHTYTRTPTIQSTCTFNNS
jgi:hypothetical protein